ncbi:oligopeptide transport system permease protein [Prosthecobacter fusiformis]|uniref:Oligopeptide transport system permease protein OppC n=1 Tax=Prosthecobacter fusiformis TaxID=48464 RepID=A0A4R7SRL0_9BACT|nr:ABC transporter permease [Prosthecobacter fusiformis]TDU81096.1 oligopeptide transport system permease protein [Prosthecobacter fusiformis]
MSEAPRSEVPTRSEGVPPSYEARTASLPLPPQSPGQRAWRRLTRNRVTIFAMLFMVALVAICVFGPFLSPYGQNDQDLNLQATGPSAAHWLGTDPLGRDLATRILVGGRISLLVGILATGVASVIGVGYGLIAGLSGRRVDALMMRLVDILYAFPFITFVIILVVIFGREFWLIFIAIGAVEWLTMARVVRGQVLALKNLEFVLAARASGAGFWHILFRHMLPNVMGPVIIYSSLTVPGVMLLEAMLSFLGLGIQPPDASWGVLIREGADSMETYPWLLIGPGLFFSATLLALNLIGDGLRDALDPKSENL